jgi:Flp pilus assembly protein TadD
MALAATLAAVGVLAYANSFNSPFILDDQSAILNNQQIRTLWPLTLPLSPPDETPVARRPLVNLSFAINFAAGGLDVAGYRRGNLILHLLAALALFGLVRRTLTLDALTPRFGKHATALAFTSALLWMLHPLQTEVVNYISQRTAAMMGLFYLLTLYCSVRGLAGRTRRWRVAAVVACAAGMACKESMATAPILVALFDRAFVFPSFRAMVRHRAYFYAALAGTWVLLAALIASGSRSTVGFDAGTGPWDYLLNQLPILVTYLRLVVWPRELVIDYGVPVPLTLDKVVWPAVVVISLIVSAAVAIRYRPRAGFLLAAVFITLAPTSSIVPIATEVGAERRMYLPLAAIAVLAVCATYRAWCVVPGQLGQYAAVTVALRRHAAWAAAVTVSTAAALFFTGTIVRNREYHSLLKLAQTAVERRPHGRVYFMLGNALSLTGQRAAAVSHFRRSARDFAPAHFALGVERLSEGQLEQGVGDLRTFVRLMPEHPSVASARHMLAMALAAQGKRDEAIAELQHVLAVGQASASVHGLMGELLLESGQHAEAVTHLERSLSRRPNDARMHNVLGTALARIGRLREAEVHFRRATELDPAMEAARSNVVAAERILAERP